MLSWAIEFFIIAVIFGFGGIAGAPHQSHKFSSDSLSFCSSSRW